MILSQIEMIFAQFYFYDFLRQFELIFFQLVFVIILVYNSQFLQLTSKILTLLTQMDYQFPLEQQTYHDCLWPDVKQIIEAQRKQYNIKCPYRYTLTKNRYVYAKCSKCRAQLKFRKDQDNKLKLVSFSNKHHHYNNSQKQQSLNMIKNYIKELPTNIQTRSAKKLVMEKFQIKESKFYYLYNQIIHPQMTFYQALQKLNNQDYTIYTDPWKQNMNFLPDLLIAVSPKMKQNYQKYGQWISLDFTYNLIRQQNLGKSFKVGSILGLSSTKRIVPFGLVITTEQTTQRYYEIFKNFFQIMRWLLPQAIITDQAISIISAINELKQDKQFRGQHLLDAYHILKNAKKHLKDKKLKDLLRNLIHCRTKDQFQQQLKICYQNFGQSDMEVLRKFVQNSQFYCFSQISPVFFGFTSSDSINQKMNDLIKDTIKYSKPYTNVLIKVLQLMDQIGHKSENGIIQKIKIQAYFGYPQIKQIRCMLDKRVFLEFSKQLSKIFEYQLVQVQRMGDSHFIIRKQNFQYKIVRQQFWKCSCLYSNKTGLPCSHLLKFCLAKKTRILDFVHKRWHLNYNIKPKSTIARPKITRRNRIK